MPNRSSKDVKEVSENSKSISKDDANESIGNSKRRLKNPAAVALGRLGGKKGGPARAKKLSKERRIEIARNAALSRWAKQREEPKDV